MSKSGLTNVSLSSSHIQSTGVAVVTVAVAIENF